MKPSMDQMERPGRKKIENEHDRMVKYNVWESVKKRLLPKGTKVIDSTWAYKKKSTGKLCGHLNACGFKQVEGVHCMAQVPTHLLQMPAQFELC
jgi:hypothetical protein